MRKTHKRTTEQGPGIVQMHNTGALSIAYRKFVRMNKLSGECQGCDTALPLTINVVLLPLLSSENGVLQSLALIM